VDRSGDLGGDTARDARLVGPRRTGETGEAGLSVAVASQASEFLVIAGVLGLIVGSFLNVVIHRLPLGESVVTPPSRCPACGARIRAIDNVPVVSWLLLRGRCRSCQARIPIRYPLVELANAALWVLVLRVAPSWGDAATGAFLCSACLALLAIDYDHQILPDWITLSGIAVGLALSFVSVRRTPLEAALGAALGAGGLFLLAFTYEKIAGQEGMGLGDVKMLGMIGALLGPAGVVVTLLLGSLSGSVVGLALIAARGGGAKTKLPFGVFLALGAISAFFFGDALVARYRALLPA
jgi:leader peptidase (prepilin peptidase)/N-methyltransferase